MPPLRKLACDFFSGRRLRRPALTSRCNERRSMETITSIAKRRSIRKFTDREIPPELVEKIFHSAIKAPSSKNRQPWKFIIVTNKTKDGMLKAMWAGIENEKKGQGLLPNSLQFISGAENTAEIMAQAPITIMVFNTENSGLLGETSIENNLSRIANVQSIGAAIENMLLTATDLGLGSLWICDIFFAYRELCAYFGLQNELVAAISLGYADETPDPRPRKTFTAVVEWR